MKNVLIVEDNELNMKLFFDILQYQKYSPDKAFDGLEAYEKIKNNKFDLIILDIQLPKLDGFSLLEKLNKEKIKIPTVIIASACAMDSDKARAKKFGIDNYITKPIDINIFLKMVKQYLDN
ncbi:MAG: response regulator [Candidatus Gastranaerophilales bacterium]|nr:response regulator [Candidatus Gastranaerophilales bacterium]